jgi:hypothetical protein
MMVAFLPFFLKWNAQPSMAVSLRRRAAVRLSDVQAIARPSLAVDRSPPGIGAALSWANSDLDSFRFGITNRRPS